MYQPHHQWGIIIINDNQYHSGATNTPHSYDTSTDSRIHWSHQPKPSHGSFFSLSLSITNTSHSCVPSPHSRIDDVNRNHRIELSSLFSIAIHHPITTLRAVLHDLNTNASPTDSKQRSLFLILHWMFQLRWNIVHKFYISDRLLYYISINVIL